MITGMITKQTAQEVIVALLSFEQQSKEDINIFIDSAGGDVRAGLSIVDTMNLVENDVSTTAIGLVASMATIILMSGANGKRSALPHSRIMMHQPASQVESVPICATDFEIISNQLNQTKKEVYELISERTGKSLSRIEDDFANDNWMSAKEAQEYGIVDMIVSGNNR